MARIVVIEDAEDIISSVDELLTETGHIVFTAKSALEGIKLVKEVLPDLIICDVLMPHMNGFSFFEDLKKESSVAGIPLIFLSATADNKMIQYGLEMGASHYITKPYDALNLLNIIDITLNKL